MGCVASRCTTRCTHHKCICPTLWHAWGKSAVGMAHEWASRNAAWGTCGLQRDHLPKSLHVNGRVTGNTDIMWIEWEPIAFGMRLLRALTWQPHWCSCALVRACAASLECTGWSACSVGSLLVRFLVSYSFIVVAGSASLCMNKLTTTLALYQPTFVPHQANPNVNV